MNIIFGLQTKQQHTQTQDKADLINIFWLKEQQTQVERTTHSDCKNNTFRLKEQQIHILKLKNRWAIGLHID